jgi:hypothetical protein
MTFKKLFLYFVKISLIYSLIQIPLGDLVKRKKVAFFTKSPMGI